MILKLPNDVFTQLLSEWLSIDCWTHLDSAICSISLRTQFLSQLHSCRATHVVRRRADCNGWLATRNVDLKGVIVDSRIRSMLLLPYLENLPLKNVQTLRLFEYHDNMVSFVNNCHSLTALYCTEGNVCMTQLDEAILKQLVLLEVESSENRHQGDLSSIQEHCKHLEALKYQCPRTPENFTLLSQIIRNNPNLHSLNIWSDVRFVHQLPTVCSPFLTSLTVSGKFDILPLKVLPRHFPRLTTLVVAGDEYSYDSVAGSLEMIVDPNSISASDWNAIFSGLPRLESIKLDTEFVLPDAFLAALADCWGTSLTKVDFWVESQMPSGLRYLFDHCTVLKTFEYSSNQWVPWNQVISSANNRLEKFRLCMNNSDLSYILLSCQYLKSFEVYSSCISMDSLRQLIVGLQTYRNRRQDMLTSKCSFWIGGDSELDLTFEDGNFGGSLWEKHLELHDLMLVKSE